MYFFWKRGEITENTKKLLSFVQGIFGYTRLPSHIAAPPYEQDAWILQQVQRIYGRTESVLAGFVDFFQNMQHHTLYHLSDDLNCHTTFMRIPKLDQILVCGPVLYEPTNSERIEAYLDKHRIPEEHRQPFYDFYHHVTLFADRSIPTGIFVTLAEHLYGVDNYEVCVVQFDHLVQWNKCYENYDRTLENPFSNVQMVEQRYALESTMIQAIHNGNKVRAIEYFYKLIAATQRKPQLPDVLRSHKNDCIVLNVLARKAAEAAGVHPVHLDTLSRQNMSLIEAMTTVQQVQPLQHSMIEQYCDLVHFYNTSQYSPLTQKVLAYVAMDLTANLSLKVIAEMVAVNASYLSTLFKKEMGVPLTEYVNRVRIAHAQQLLLVTDLPIKTIAMQCGIPDIAYFTKLFKKYADATPRAYRDAAATNLLKASLQRLPNRKNHMSFT